MFDLGVSFGIPRGGEAPGALAHAEGMGSTWVLLPRGLILGLWASLLCSDTLPTQLGYTETLKHWRY